MENAEDGGTALAHLGDHLDHGVAVARVIDVAAGRLPVRERVAQLLDEGTFREIGSLTSKIVYDEDGNEVASDEFMEDEDEEDDSLAWVTKN